MRYHSWARLPHEYSTHILDICGGVSSVDFLLALFGQHADRMHRDVSKFRIVVPEQFEDESDVMLDIVDMGEILPQL